MLLLLSALSCSLQIISSKLGYVTDIHGNSMAAAVPFSIMTPNADGVTAKAIAYGIIRYGYTFSFVASGLWLWD